MWDWLFQFVDPIDRAEIPYALVGSVASSVYGEPRATNDVDLVIQIHADQAHRLIEAFPQDHFYLPPEEVLLAELGRGHGAHLNVIAMDSMIKADLYPLPADQRAWFARRSTVALAGRNIWVAAPEVVILHKLLFFREGGGEKHLRDIGGMLATLGPKLDRRWLDDEAKRLGVDKALRDADANR